MQWEDKITEETCTKDYANSTIEEKVRPTIIKKIEKQKKTIIDANSKEFLHNIELNQEHVCKVQREQENVQNEKNNKDSLN